MAYSLDLRKRVLAAIDDGLSQVQAERTFQVGHSTITRWRAQRAQTGTLAARHSPGRPRAIGAAEVEALRTQLLAQPDATLDRHVETWQQTQQRLLSPATLSRSIARLGWTRKKSRCAPASKTLPSARPSKHVSTRARRRTA